MRGTHRKLLIALWILDFGVFVGGGAWLCFVGFFLNTSFIKDYQ